MKRKVYKANEIGELSPHTKSGEIVFSRLHVEPNPEEPMNPYHIEFVPEASDALKVLHFLDEMNGIGWTPTLKKLERDLRTALLDMMTSDTPTRSGGKHAPQSNTRP
jgi:hypothetical protein